MVTNTDTQTINPTATPSAISDLSSWDLAACSAVMFVALSSMVTGKENEGMRGQMEARGIINAERSMICGYRHAGPSNLEMKSLSFTDAKVG